MNPAIQLPGTIRSVPSSSRPESRSTPGFTDGLGERFVEFDLASSIAVERLRFKNEFADTPAFEAAIRDRIERFEYFRHPAIATARSVSRHADGSLVLESKHTPGRRLSEHTPEQVQELALDIIRQITPALAALHEAGEDMVHGLLSADRIVVTREGRLVLVEHVLGSAMAALRWPAARLREEFGLALPAGPQVITLDQADDLTELGLIVLSILLGRRVTPAEYPEKIEQLVGESAKTSADLTPESAWLRRWVERAVRVGPHPFKSAREAVETLGELSDGKVSTATRSRTVRPASEPVAAPPFESSTQRSRPFKVDESKLQPATGHSNAWPQHVDDGHIAVDPIAVATTPTPVATAKPVVTIKTPTPIASPRVAAPTPEPPRPAAVKEIKPAPPKETKPAPPVKETKPVAPVARETKPAEKAKPEPRPAPPSGTRSWLVPGLATIAVVEGIVIAVLLVAKPQPVAAVPEPTHTVATAPVTPPPVVAPPTTAPPAPPAKPATETASHPDTAAALPAADQFGGVKVTSPFELQVFEGSKLLGVTAGPIALMAGSHTLDLVNDALEFKSHVVTTVKPGQLTPLTVAAPQGKISVNAVPWADVLIDGNPAGQTPLANVSVTIGQHEIVFRHPQLGELHQTATVKVTTPTRISVTFQK